MFGKTFEGFPQERKKEKGGEEKANILLQKLEQVSQKISERFLSKDGEIDQSRREFLRKASDIGKGAVIGASVGGSFHIARYLLEKENFRKDDENPLIQEAQNDTEVIKEVSPSEGEEVEAQEAFLEEENITENPLDEIFQRENIEGRVFDEELMRKASLYWKYMHSEGSREKDFSEGYERMKPWEDRVCLIFEEEGVPRELAYLALPESYWNQENWVSPAGARGPYQIMGRTGEAFGVGSERDREDPLKSARAAAKILQENYKRMDNDWQLALCAYNGGFAWNYRKEMSYNNLSYPDFLRYMSEEIQKESEYEVKSGDVLGVIAQKVGSSVEEIQQKNNLSGDGIRIGQKLTLPGGVSEREKRHMEENLNYVPKVEGILLALKEKGILKKMSSKQSTQYTTLEEMKRSFA